MKQIPKQLVIRVAVLCTFYLGSLGVAQETVEKQKQAGNASPDVPFQEVGLDSIEQKITSSSVDLPANPFAHDEQLACGPRCVQFALNMFGKPVDYEQLIDSCTLGPQGTSMLQLNQALKDGGLNVVPLGNVSVRNLKLLRYPAIVHLSQEVETGHFLIVLGWSESEQKFRIFNPPNRYKKVPETDFIALLSGQGLAFSNQKMPPAEKLIEPQPSHTFLILLSLFSCGLLVYCLAGSSRTGKRNTDEHADSTSKANSPVTAGTALLLLIAIAGCNGIAATKAPVDPRTAHVGEYVAGPMLQHEFNIPNDGEKPFHVIEVRKTCGCHSTEFDTRRLVQPGESAQVVVNLPTAGNEGKTMYRFVMVTDSPEKKLEQIPMSLTVDLRSKIKAFPSRLTFGKLQAGTRKISTITITSREVDPRVAFRSWELAQDLPTVTVRQHENTAKGTIKFDVQVAEDAPLGDLAGFVVLKFDDREVPEIRVPVIGRIEGVIRATPNVLVRNTGEITRAVVRLGSKNGEAFEVTGIRSQPQIRLEAENQSGEKRRYRVVIDEDITPGNYTIVFETDHPVQKSITLPVVIH